jgi:hypothetical protein
MRTVAIILLALAMAACASSPPAGDRVTQAVESPLSDLNIVRAPIPPPLEAALKGPYLRPADASCAGLQSEVRALDGVLGADLDTPSTPSNPSLIEQGVTAAGDAAVGTVRSTAEGVMPFRRWIRKLSGAEKYSKEVAAAISAGVVRRSFLKGLGDAAGCPVPAAPWRHGLMLNPRRAAAAAA